MKFGEIIEQLDIWYTWRDNYNKYVPKFIEEAKTGKNWKEWDKDIFYEFFEKSREHCVASLQQGYFTNEEKEGIKREWDQLAPMLQKLSLNQEKPLFDVYKEIKDFLRTHTSQNRKAATNRLIASLQPKLLCTIVNEHNLWQLFNYLKNDVNDIDIPIFIGGDWFKNSYNLWKLYQDNISDKDYSEMVTFPWETFEYYRKEYQMSQTKDNDMSEENPLIRESINLLKYKNQIILQGAPGTGKTYNAKLIAKELVKKQIELKEKPSVIRNSDISNILVEGLKITSVSNYTEYKIEKIENNKIELSGNNIEHKIISFHKIISSYENKQWEPNKIINNLDSYEAALAFYIYNTIENVVEYKDKEKYIKLVQFHPSYSYEDFVRGIIVNTNNGVPEYINQNKILGDFAKEAYNNLLDSQKTEEEISKKEWLTDQFEKFVDFINEEIVSNLEDNYQLTDNVNIIAVENDAFRYTGNNWKHGSNRMLFRDIIEAFLDGNKTRQDIKNNNNLSGLAKQHASYYIRVLDHFREYLNDLKITYTDSSKNKIKLNNYVLIIDEINRANLSTVLGELIYALEYRDEKVESMYAVDGDNELILPSNLYIIGTMNTADRSVGQIDYAIRRRFAFVDMLPTILDREDFDSDLFEKVSGLFIKNIEEYIKDNTISLLPSDHLSSEFCPEDVWIGHSYFIMEEVCRDMRLKYEIIPILKEYLKDGILKESAKEIIEKLR